jgi:hypothetical protein
MTKEPKDQIRPGAVTLTYEMPGHNPPSVTLLISDTVFWPAYETIHRIGVRETYGLLNFAGDLSDALQKAGVPDVQEAFQALWERIGDPGRMGNIQWEDTTEAALVVTYTLLRNGHIGWERAASIAGIILKKDITPDAWRRRMGRWTKNTEREPIRIYNQKRDETSIT